MEGARRMLACALCGGEWPFAASSAPPASRRTRSSSRPFRRRRTPTVRIEACETCRRYVKSIDLSEDARPIPEVDDLAQPLDGSLGGREQGFERIEPGPGGTLT